MTEKAEWKAQICVTGSGKENVTPPWLQAPVAACKEEKPTSGILTTMPSGLPSQDTGQHAPKPDLLREYKKTEIITAIFFCLGSSKGLGSV